MTALDTATAALQRLAATTGADQVHVRQLLLGIDQGAEALFGCYVPELYARHAAELGIPVAALTREQHLEALTSAAERESRRALGGP